MHWSKGRVVGAMAASLVAGCLTMLSSGGEAARTCPQVAGHRGASKVAPENTLPALESAAGSGADFVEFDVRFTRSGTAVLLHDPTVNRTTTGSGSIASMWDGQVATLDAGADFSPSYTGTRVPTLGAALRALAPGRSIAVVELKSAANAAQMRDLSGHLQSHGMAGRVVFQSTDIAVLRQMRALAPSLPQALSTGYFPSADPLAAAKLAKVQWWLPALRTITESSVKEAQAAGIKVMPWVLDSPAQWEQAAAWGVDAVLTDIPSEYRGWAIARCDP